MCALLIRRLGCLPWDPGRQRRWGGGALSSPGQAGPTLGVVLRVPRRQHRGPEEALAVLVAPADLVAALGELLRGAGDAAVVLVSGAVAAGLAGDGDTGESAAAPAMTRCWSL